MRKVKGIKRYVKQFLSTVDMGEAPHAIEQLSALADLMVKDKNFRNLIVSPVLSEAESRQIIG